MQDNDTFRLFSKQAVENFLACVAFLGFVFVAAYAPDLEKVAPAKIVQAEPKKDAPVVLSHPLPYTATATQSGPGIDTPRTRYYVPSSAGK